jgi:DNA-binding NtrC family response regulator
MTAYASVETAVSHAQGAYDYLTKPFINDEIRVMLRRALNQRHLSRETVTSNGAANATDLEHRGQ